jgi:methionyl-tRNA formyltransferase
VSDLRIAFAGDRDISVWVLDHLQAEGVHPLALLVSDADRASHADELRRRCEHLAPDHVMVGGSFREPQQVELLSSLALDLVVSIHFPYLYPAEVLCLPRHGVLNLHPAYLPYNRGWHTPSWGLLDGTPLGATLHFMDAGVDTGDIVAQSMLEPSPGDTAHSLYTKLKHVELELFRASWPEIASGRYQRHPQQPDAGTVHKRRDLFRPEVQQIDLDVPVPPSALLRRLRALTTNDVAEAAYYQVEGTRYHVQVVITPADDQDVRGGTA